MDEANTKEEFLKELAALLEKYKGTIGWTCAPCSDTHGIYDDCIYIEQGDREIFRSESGYLDACKLKQFLEAKQDAQT